MEGSPRILKLRLKDCSTMFIINVGLGWIRLYQYLTLCKFVILNFKLGFIKNVSLNRGHIFMGFTVCGKYFVSYTEKIELSPGNFYTTNEYELYIWRFVPGQRLQFVSKHRIFKLLKTSEELHDIKFMQFPSDPYKLICYGIG